MTGKRFKKSKPNYLYAIVGVALVLFLLGFFGLVLLQGQLLLRQYKEQINILVELKSNAQSADVRALERGLAEADYTKPASVQFVSKEAAARQLEEELGEEFSALGFSNPLYDVVHFNVQANYLDSDSLLQIKQQLKKHSFVNDVFYQESMVDNIAQNLEKIGYISLIIGILFIFVAVVLIHNTIRLALYANRFLIKNMQLIGASWGFISRPYLWRSFKNGIWSAIIAIILLAIVLQVFQTDLIDFRDLSQQIEVLFLLIGLIAIGIIISVWSTYYIVNKYLKMRVDDLY